jgi:hypothetical protein
MAHASRRPKSFQETPFSQSPRGATLIVGDGVEPLIRSSGAVSAGPCRTTTSTSPGSRHNRAETAREVDWIRFCVKICPET